MTSEVKWKLIQVGSTDWQADTSGLYTIIHRVETPMVHKGYAGTILQVRLDLMTDDGNPIVSFIGKAENVRKALMQYLAGQYNHAFPLKDEESKPKRFTGLSMEHAAYIGYELHRALFTPGYVQD